METYKRNWPTIPLLGIFLLLHSCSTDPTGSGSISSIFSSGKLNIDECKESLAVTLADTTYAGIPDSTWKDLQQAYSRIENKAVWLNNDGLNEMALALSVQLDSLQYDGFPVDTLGARLWKDAETLLQSNDVPSSKAVQAELMLSTAFLRSCKKLLFDDQPDSNKEWKIKNDSSLLLTHSLHVLDSLQNTADALNWMRPKHFWYSTFRKEYGRVMQETIAAGSQEAIRNLPDSIPESFTDPGLTALRKTLYRRTKLPLDTVTAGWNDSLFQAVKLFQYRHQIKQTGKLDSVTKRLLTVSKEHRLQQLALNMARMRRMPNNFKQPYIWVAVPKMELDYVEHDTIGFNMRVVVGRPSRPTPSLQSKIENIVFSPPWTVPPTIMKEEVLPGIARRGGSYLARRGLKAYDRRGRVVNASAINSKNFRSYSIGQAPGYRSSLGEVKFNMINPWAIYLHDTPHREDFVKAYRAFSSGCIRVHHPKQFAEFLLRDTAKYSFQKIDSICKRRRTQYVPMKRDIAVHVVYLTNALDSTGQVMYLKDIYHWDQRL